MIFISMTYVNNYIHLSKGANEKMTAFQPSRMIEIDGLPLSSRSNCLQTQLGCGQFEWEISECVLKYPTSGMSLERSGTVCQAQKQDTKLYKNHWHFELAHLQTATRGAVLEWKNPDRRILVTIWKIRL